MNLAQNLLLVILYYLLLKVDSKCPKSFQCGHLGSLEFPFSKDGNCGLFLVENCESQSLPILAKPWTLMILERKSSNSFLLYDDSLHRSWSEKSCSSLRNFSLPQSPFVSFSLSHNLTLFSCHNQTYNEYVQSYFHDYERVQCHFHPPSVYYREAHVPVSDQTSIPSDCSVVYLPKNPDKHKEDLFDQLSPKFTLEWNVSEGCSECYHGGGLCLSDKMNKFYCKKVKTRFRKILLIGGGIVAALISASIILVLFIRRKYTSFRLFGYQKAKLEYERNIELFLKNNGNLVPLRYRYADIEKMTKSFSENLGKGGYGSVYKGKLHDGHLVAVKILNESKENGEEFMNEVASISRTSHVNIVTLLGFCFEGRKRALIYEFMPNGSLEKFIQNTADGGLGWQKLFEISLGIARGLEYLHQGCKTRILHFDIKPHNILLDENFNPRISNFGLAKMCPNRSSIVSMMVARGTIGYIAPEVFCRNFGEVSHKSDVYSYGMMVLEIAGGKKNIDRADVDHTSEVYFPHYIYKQLEMDDAERDGSHGGIRNGDESHFARRKLVIVGLWCIQTDPKDRPSMTKVVEMLEGNLESLQVPPKPYISSPQDQHLMFSTSETM